ncbi:sugar phosphate isomerase/epimerase family protein [Bremerella sp. P1]|uniref:sugar phosphate isomerase/epimerase family protein n=1 Tax=Bremerella sp. P1 TaxID=3026424 RepID=UPI002368D144|nr:sugar phosphate isomerase/epimerase family protein [Bremerella sp. P1]WDI42929.1 sugar phosphate isomerase/epimerase [Bremerella sp. P1]
MKTVPTLLYFLFEVLPMSTSRREFLANCSAAAAAGLALSTPASLLAADNTTASGEKRIKKAVKIGMVGVKGTLAEKMTVLKELGFDGVELNSPGGPEAEEVQKAVEVSGIPVHGVVDSIHWNTRLSDPDEEVRQKGLEGLFTAINASKSYGGTSVLLVPGVVNKDVTYDQCWDRSIEQIKKALPLAEELNIQILMENVWNNFLTDPKETARFIDEIDSDMVGAYFDVGNTVKYSPPHEWVPILGPRIKKLDIKDFGKGKGFGAKLLEGDVDWPKVMANLREIDYQGWATAEISGGGRERLTEIADRMDRIFAS